MLFKKPSGVQWIVVFLGNPGKKYEKTRHNAGFMTGDALSESLGLRPGINQLRFRALTCRCDIGGQSALLMKPQTYMNLSGESVIQAVQFYKLPPERVLVVSDDLDLPVGKLRIRRKGSSGGHNGLKSLIQHLGTEDFPRVKIGIGSPPHEDYDVIDWVTATFSAADGKTMAEAVKKAADAVVTYISDGPERAMEKYN